MLLKWTINISCLLKNYDRMDRYWIYSIHIKILIEFHHNFFFFLITRLHCNQVTYATLCSNKPRIIYLIKLYLYILFPTASISSSRNFETGPDIVLKYVNHRVNYSRCNYITFLRLLTSNFKSPSIEDWKWFYYQIYPEKLKNVTFSWTVIFFSSCCSSEVCDIITI